tara:strand:- start:22751 stop:22864 length:114 start_codon:yes stop_codon:yes gene_type:complete
LYLKKFALKTAENGHFRAKSLVEISEMLGFSVHLCTN